MSSSDTNLLHLLKTRRSIVARDMGDEGPDVHQLNDILQAGLRVPDHGKLGPWRFIVFEGAARAQFGGVLEAAYLASGMPDEDDRRQFERERFTRAPVVVAVISIVKPESKLPEWEQILSSGAACQHMLNAAASMGFAGQWLTEWYAYDPMVLQALQLHENERVAGFMYFGSVVNTPNERVRPALDDKVSRWRLEL